MDAPREHRHSPSQRCITLPGWQMAELQAHIHALMEQNGMQQDKHVVMHVSRLPGEDDSQFLKLTFTAQAMRDKRVGMGDIHDALDALEPPSRQR